MLLLIDNYDSFTYNLYQYFGGLGQTVEVVRNDEVGVEEIKALAPDYIVISAGPSTPNEAGISNEVILSLGQSTPLLGVCLGHQCIGQCFGGRIINARAIMHGKVDVVRHNGSGVFDTVPSPFNATLYNSLVVEFEESANAVLEVNAWTGSATDGSQQIMGLRHKSWPVEGVQFHPESILSEHGMLILANFLNRHQPNPSTSPIDTTRLPVMVR
ncbi:MAG: aminodeoxychorismate/anthranilate synthase component II [Gammaproteobacteria bacterium]|nr:aminodeoxychorismate/anthranilate synthase component II [Gammaproteobacteria bacterium]